MRKVRILCLLLLLVVLITPPAMALDIYGFGSYWDKKDADGSWGTGLGLSPPLFTEHLRLDGRVYFFRDSDFGYDDSLTLTPVDLGLQVHFMPASKVAPYLLGGISYIFADADHLDVDASFGGYVGGGLEWALGTSLLKLFGEIVYRFDTLDSNGPRDVDVSGINGNVGFKIHF